MGVTMGEMESDITFIIDNLMATITKGIRGFGFQEISFDPRHSQRHYSNCYEPKTLIRVS